MHSAVLSLLLALSPAVAEAAGWQRVSLPGDQPVSVELLGTPGHKHTDKAVFLGKVSSDTVYFDAPGGWCAATLTDAPNVAMSMASTNTILGTAKTSILKDTAGTEQAWDPVARSGVSGRRLTLTTVKDQPAGRTGRSEVYTWGHWVATFTCVFDDTADKAPMNRFFASIALPRPS